MMEYLHVDNMAECKECEWRYICGGGCPVGKLTVFENPAANSKTVKYCGKIRCDYTKKTIELLLWDLAKEASGEIGEGIRNKVSVAIGNTVNC
jgi:uncharacterized protein